MRVYECDSENVCFHLVQVRLGFSNKTKLPLLVRDDIRKEEDLPMRTLPYDVIFESGTAEGMFSHALKHLLRMYTHVSWIYILCDSASACT